MPPEFPHTFKDAGVPVVHAFGRYSPTPDVHIVGIDNIHCGALAAETLINRGYQRLAFLGGPQAATSTQDRQKGFIDKLKDAGFSPVDIRYARAYAYDAGFDAMRDLLAEKKVEAVFCGDDLICMGAMDAARKQGFVIPEDLGFIGFNDMNMSGWRAYDLTTVHQPLTDIIMGSVDLIVSLIEKPDRPPEARLLPCRVMERSSLRPMPG